MTWFRSRRAKISIVVLLLILFLFRPGLHQLRNRIAASISAALGRRVELQNVRLRFLPRPGFELDGLIIYDDPAFSAEPMVQASEVSAPIRLSSLLRGRLEISTLSADQPSINLVRTSDGRWNLSTLLERSSQIPAAPTGKRALERRPGFPYLEATHARINFKVGQEKTPFALSDADVALWQESENSWGARLAAQPVRTEFHLTDTGLLRVSATWQRAPRLSETPLQATISWQKGQLGQITKLFSGSDRGWRGGLGLDVNLSGTPQSLLVRSQIVVNDFRRYDIPNRNLRLASQCSASYNAADRELTDLFCESPVADGFARLRGNIGPFSNDLAYDFTFSAEKVPLSQVLRLVGEAKQGLPLDLGAAGNLNAEFHAHRDPGQPPQVDGEGSLTAARVASSAEKNEIVFGDVPLRLAQRSDNELSKNPAWPAEPSLQLGPFPVAIAGSSPMAAGWLSRSGYFLSLRGDTSLKSVFRLAKTLGIPVYHPAVQGTAHIDVHLAGTWKGFGAPEVLGNADLKNVHAELRGFNQPVEIGAATLSLTPDALTLQKISARTGSTHWNGSITSARHCASPRCAIQFNLSADQLSAHDLAEWFSSHPAKRPWYRLLSSSEIANRPSPLLEIKGSGNLRVGRFELQRLISTQFAAHLELENGSVTLSGLRAQLLQGTHQGRWTVDFSHVPLRYQGSGSLQNISLTQLSALMNDGWCTGTADARFEVSSSGMQWPDWLNQADGRLQFTVRDGTLPHLDLPGSPRPFPVHRFLGELRLNDGKWALHAAKLESRDGIYQVSGTASQAVGLGFVLTRGDDLSWNISGGLSNPHVSPAIRTEAKTALKP